MTRFPRGAVVVRGGRYSVVWSDTSAGLILLPLIRPRASKLHDVPIEGLSDVIACNAPIAHAVIRPEPRRTRETGHELAGTVPGATMCRVVQSLVRKASEAAIVAKWEADRRHQGYARSSGATR